MRDYAELIKALRIFNVNYDSNKLTNDAADAIEELLARDVVPTDFHERCLQIEIRKRIELEKQLPHWISVRDVSDEEICAAKMVLSVIENLDKPMLMYDIEKSAVKKALLLMLRICEAEPPKEVG